MKIQQATMFAMAMVLAVTLGACSDYKDSGGSENPEAAKRASLESKAAATVAKFKADYPEYNNFFNTADAYAVFPSIGKGAIGVGGAYGKGVLYENGQVVGYTSLSQGTVGLQLGGQTYSEIIFLEGPLQVAEFKAGDTAFSGQATAVAASKGSGANADYEDGVAVFTFGEEGLMGEASVGGQKFSYTAK